MHAYCDDDEHVHRGGPLEMTSPEFDRFCELSRHYFASVGGASLRHCLAQLRKMKWYVRTTYETIEAHNGRGVALCPLHNTPERRRQARADEALARARLVE